MKRIFFLILVFLLQLVSCQTHTKSNMNANAELIFNKELDKNLSVECFVDNSDNYYTWEFKIKGKENKTLDQFKISKQKLNEYSPLAGRPGFYKQFKVIAAFKNLDNIVFLLDKFGQVDVQLYSLSGKSSRVIIPFKSYQLSPMDTDILGEDFQDVKMVNNTIYTLSKHLRENSTIYRISMADLIDKKAQESLINVSVKESVKNQNGEHKTIVQLEDSSYKSTGFGFKFSLLDNNLLEIKKDNADNFMTRINFTPSKMDKNKDINTIIE